MHIISSTGPSSVATVFVGRTSLGSEVEFVESLQPPRTIEEKWVLIISTLKGCPVNCIICDAGGSYKGVLRAEELLEQIDALVDRRFPDRRVPSKQFKIQFSRVGDPAFNDGVLQALEALPSRYQAPGLMPSISSIAPVGKETFFERLADIKNRLYPNGSFQMQFSVHSTDEKARRSLIPCRTWSLEQMGEWGSAFFREGDRKITLNFAPAQGYPVDADVLARCFSPLKFMIKLTPVNPTAASTAAGIEGIICPDRPETGEELACEFRKRGFDCLVSIGALEENQIGSNCGMYLRKSS